MSLMKQIAKFLPGMWAGCYQAIVPGEPGLANGLMLGDLVKPRAQVQKTPNPLIKYWIDAEGGYFRQG
jgi:hypothetical protein